MKKSYVLIFSLILVSCISCTTPVDKAVSMIPPKQFTENDLFGLWKISNSQYSFESLELRKNHTFSQTFRLIDSDYVFEVDGTWEMIAGETECAYIHLKEMRFYYQVFEIAENRNMWGDDPEYYWDSCSEKPVQMVGKTILSIGSHPDSSNGVVLWHMSSQKNGTNMVFEYSGKKAP
ncbi:MAG: hypothetical protein GY755_15135 [Chloroflexi bacterium]|nr:hypothetical protein [Chloroflexota bacterium]